MNAREKRLMYKTPITGLSLLFSSRTDYTPAVLRVVSCVRFMRTRNCDRVCVWFVYVFNVQVACLLWMRTPDIHIFFGLVLDVPADSLGTAPDEHMGYVAQINSY
jgi:hypothetical protein